MQINLSVQNFCSHTLHNDLLARMMNDTNSRSAGLAHLSSNLFILQPYAVGTGHIVIPTILHRFVYVLYMEGQYIINWE